MSSTESEFSEDDSPQDISFKSSKDNALKNIKSMKDALTRENQLRKQQRQAIELRNVEQKKRKILSLDILEQADKALQRQKTLKQKLEEKSLEVTSDGEEEEEEDDDDEDEGSQGVENVYVPISQSKSYTKPANDSAANFKAQHFFNGRIKRISNTDQRRLNWKRKISKRR